MRMFISPFAAALSLMLTVPLTFIASSSSALAQDQKSAASQDAVKQIPLTAAQIDSFLLALKPVSAITSKFSEADSENPSPKLIAQLDAVVKPFKFASYEEYQNVADNIDLVMAGIDPQTKKYVGADVIIKQEIAEITADKSMSAKDKKDQLDELNAALKAVTPVTIPGNIDLIVKYYDKLGAAMPQDSQ
jgi:hypothetical protein